MKRSLQLDASRRPPKYNQVLKCAHVQETLKLLDKSIARSIKSVNNLKSSTDRQTLALLYEANVFSNDMQRTVYNLQKIVITTFTNGNFDPELEDAVKQFSQFAYSVQQCFNDDPEMLKNQIKENLSNIILEAHRLVESVISSKNQEHIHEIVCVVDDLLFAVSKIEYRNKLEALTPDYLLTEVIKLKHGLIDKFHSFKHINHSVLRELKHTGRVSAEKTFRMVKLLDETADNYSEDIKNVLLQASFAIMPNLAEIDSGIRLNNDVVAIKCYKIIGICAVCLELENLVELLKINIADEQVSNNLHNLVILIVIHEMATGEQLLRNIELAKNHSSDY